MSKNVSELFYNNAHVLWKSSEVLTVEVLITFESIFYEKLYSIWSVWQNFFLKVRKYLPQTLEVVGSPVRYNFKWVEN